MNNGIKYTFVFALGAAIGSVVTWKVIENKYKQIAQEEIDSVKEVFAKRNTEETEGKLDDDTESDSNAYVSALASYANTEEKGGSEPMVVNEPRVIMPEEFGEEDDYGTESLTYYADGVLTDDQDIPIESVAEMVGSDFASHFGEFEDDSVFIRNDYLKTDFEILADSRNYEDRVITRESAVPNPMTDDE